MAAQMDFYTLLGRILLQGAYSGINPGGGWRFGPPEKDHEGRRFFNVPESAGGDVDRFTEVAPLFPAYDYAFQGFVDNESSRILALLVAHIILGPERIRLTITPEQYGDGMKQLAPLMIKERTYDVNFQNIKLDLYDLTSAGMPVKVHTTRSALLAHFFLQQYGFKRGNDQVTVEPGDTVIEGGMCYGDTALLFALLAGESGRVIGYEFEPDNLRILENNTSMNPELAARIRVVHNAVFNRSGVELKFVMAGPATCLLPANMPPTGRKQITVETLSIDDLVAREKLDRVDFIKLDVEGVEYETMVGATETLKRFRPKLALSAYHKVDDVPKLMSYVQSLNLGYRFWLDHFRPHREETVLFAKCR